MALLFPHPALSPKPPFPSTRTRRTTCISGASSALPSAAAPSPSTSSPYKAPAPDGGAEVSKKKKRRNLKPSFEEQALRRWSARAPSQRSSFPWQRQPQQQPRPAHREDEAAHAQEPTSATLRSIVEYFDYDSSAGGDGGVDVDVGAGARGDRGAGKGKNSVALGEAAQVRDEEPRSQPSYLLGSRPVSAPWMHGQERHATVDRLVSGPADDGDEEEADRNGVFDDELGSVEEDEEWVDNLAVLEEEPIAEDLEGELYEDEDPASPTANSSFQLDPILDRGSTGSGFDMSTRRSSVSSIVNTLRNSMEESATIGRSDAEDFVQKLGPVLLPWEREGGGASDGGMRRKHTNAELAERTIPEPELRRLRDVALRMKERMRVGPGGVTQAVVETIHSKWKVDEVVKMRFEGPPSLNMKRTHELLEDRTGGTVIWRSGRSIVLYRGMNYNLRCVQSYAKTAEVDSSQEAGDAISAVPSSLQKSSANDVNRATSIVIPSQEATETFDIDSFLDQLGPRYKDWSGRSPIPVDADLLPGLVPGYKPPFRQLPYRTKISLKDKEMTALRRLARQTTPHFALGRNREHQGLATAIVKLWEKSSIVKIAIKRGVPNTSNDRMAEEIKKLTGGVLVSRNKEYIIFYRGNDFVTPKVRQVLVEQQQHAITQQDQEELARLKAAASIAPISNSLKNPLVAGTLAETREATSRWGESLNDELRKKENTRLILAKHTSLLRNMKRKLILAKTKVAKAEMALAKVQKYLSPAELPTDLETVTDEERFLFRRIGLKMKAFLMLGRREVFDGTVQNMHFHWKHRELVKIVVKGKTFEQVKHIAISLEAESGGVLIALDRTTKGYSIIFYRGKNYKRPEVIKPRNLLTRRKAMARSIELQRREALNHHISVLRHKIWKMKSQLVQMRAAGERQDAGLLQTVDEDLSSDDDNIEDEGDEAYLQTYISDDEDDADNDSNEYL
ncbi:CRM-domain containing factor CFM3, chloroplastic/mitochondrial [Lolium perenne]|uniref:CRM-domain containing factor CFM3, chloroplastic/mitochondrial n=1 Tax=Lolium perenne TaxID=4522 RepID=UPI0021F656D9|nr:CRM-domain containing factor CFM3, chloroplastic/mitochondrial-like [Lolium perenne]